ncbi:REC domain-containing diguanylate cyclase [Brasilonema octagenarum UFV-E1]|uniref:REC domain-containing diguanylate cyclase n=1 Tax=Brasilonema sennae CENA114 TaxID=415709 RepID=A0A856MGH0_9CYAN|nr:diguanylate cyclase [Brasilonema sennae]QDL10465.1 REC domain-containing diguanylate cyclase [Brasilonema sennae CENA114]QDL16811.1 REC domain-containing diguanylate cyclase [Brasilonema octagenarum UFV-E1]
MCRLKILVVEYEKKKALDIKKLLQNLGHFVSEITEDEEGAVKKMEEINPNLVLFNISLSGKKDDVKLADVIMNDYQVPVLYLTERYSIIKKIERKLTESLNYINEPVAEQDLQIAIEMAVDKHQTKKQFQEQQQNFMAILKSMGCAVMLTDTCGCIHLMNPIAEELTGWTQEEAVTKNLAEILSLVDKDTGILRKDLATQVIQTGVVLNLPETLTLIAKDHTEIQIGGNIAPIRDDDGSLIGAVVVFQDITQRKQTEAQLVRNAFYDALTGLPNRVLFLERLSQVFERRKRRNNENYAVLFLDVDGFKGINDTFGHSAGDNFLIEIARRLESCLRSADTVARFGGDEFAILIEDIKDLSDTINVAQRIQEALKLPIYIEEYKISISASIGIALSCSNYEQPESLLRDADMAMYDAKQQGKARYVVFNSQNLYQMNRRKK